MRGSTCIPPCGKGAGEAGREVASVPLPLERFELKSAPLDPPTVKSAEFLPFVGAGENRSIGGVAE
ncbi:MAG: hypothetical protein AMXMBFR83_19580 [Phycisphaerae bacterium]